MAGKKATRTMRKQQVSIQDLDIEGLVAAVKEAASKCPDPEAGRAMKRELHAKIRKQLEQVEAVWEAETEQGISDMRELRRNLPSAVANLTIGEIRQAGGYFGPDDQGNVCFRIPASLYKTSGGSGGGGGGSSSQSRADRELLVSAKKRIETATAAAAAGSSSSSKASGLVKRMSKRGRTTNPNTPSSSAVKSKMPKLAPPPPQPPSAVRHSVRQSERVTRSVAKFAKSGARLVSRPAMSAQERERERAEVKKRETEFVDALDAFSLNDRLYEASSKPQEVRDDEQEDLALGAEAAAAAAVTTGSATQHEEGGSGGESPVLQQVQIQLQDLSLLANPTTPQGRHRLLPKAVRVATAGEPVHTIHVSKDGTPLIVPKRALAAATAGGKSNT